MALYVLYGVAERDPEELVCQLFNSAEDREEFADVLPGTYQRMKIHGANYKDIVTEREE